MTVRDLMKAPGMRYALLAVLLGAATAAWAAVRAFKAEAAEVEAQPVTLSSAGLPTPPPVIRLNVREIVSADVFSPERTAPSKRYLLFGESEEVARTTTPPREPPRPVLLGTVLNPDSSLSFATMQMGGGRPTNVRIGGKLGDFTLISVERNKVVVLNAAGTPVDIYTQR